jgi:hypothetical protein
VYPFLRSEGRRAAHEDYVADYYRSALFPAGYRALYEAAARLGLVRELSRWLPYVLLVLTVSAVSLAAYRFGGLPAAWMSAALALSSGACLGRMAGGIPRSFAFPIVAGIILALVRGSVAGLAVMAVAGALFYPMAAVIAGLCLAVMLFVPGASPEGVAANWRIGRRMVAASAVAVACVLAVSPMLLGGLRYGPRIAPDDVVRLPEAGPGGRYRGHNRPPFAGVARFSARVLEDAVPGAGRPFASRARQWLDEDVSRRRQRLLIGALLLVAGAGWIRMSAVDAAARRFLVLPVVAVLTYPMARLVFPYLYIPARYLFYSVPPVAYMVLSAGGVGLLPSGRIDRKWAGWLGAIPGAVALILLGGQGSPDVGIRRVEDYPAASYAAIRGLPDSALLAGWPSGMIDYAPYLTGRRALVTFESHQVFHEGYLLEMRRRTEAVVEAFYACDARPLVRLRDEFDVSHFVVDLELARTRSAEYFTPFDREIRRAREGCAGRELEILRRRDSAAIYEDEKVAILDLSRLAARPASRVQSGAGRQ